MILPPLIAFNAKLEAHMPYFESQMTNSSHTVKPDMLDTIYGCLTSCGCKIAHACVLIIAMIACRRMAHDRLLDTPIVLGRS